MYGSVCCSVSYACEKEEERRTNTAYFMICNSFWQQSRQFTENHFIPLIPVRITRPPESSWGLGLFSIGSEFLLVSHKWPLGGATIQ